MKELNFDPTDPVKMKLPVRQFTKNYGSNHEAANGQ